MSLNEELLDMYSNCTNSAEVIKSQETFLENERQTAQNRDYDLPPTWYFLYFPLYRLFPKTFILNSSSEDSEEEEEENQTEEQDQEKEEKKSNPNEELLVNINLKNSDEKKS